MRYPKCLVAAVGFDRMIVAPVLESVRRIDDAGERPRDTVCDEVSHKQCHQYRQGATRYDTPFHKNEGRHGGLEFLPDDHGEATVIRGAFDANVIGKELVRGAFDAQRISEGHRLS